ncbi:DUF3048 domain-containing protein [Saccharopolyspora griseoalba]|uniref:DUF3048 domain-containing protein n=1 Tax=Saccharopolyspora griseoalba TaxID=1431848 RepID=A0ABW2LDD5_9PSEU
MRRLRALCAALMVLAVLGVSGCGLFSPAPRGDEAPAPPPSGAPAPGGGAHGAPDGPPVLAVKIDNVAEGRPPVGLAAAEMVFAEPVEGGFSRLLAIFGENKPPVIGPVRSARETDAQILPQFGKPVLAYSGVAPEIRPVIDQAPLIDGSDQAVPQAYSREPARPTPHNLFVDPAQLPTGEPWPGANRPLVGELPDGGQPAENYEVRYPSARIGFFYNHQSRLWNVSMDGDPYAAINTGRIGASTVIVQHVNVHDSVVRDAAGNPSPVVETVGSGRILMLREGRSFEGRWERPSPTDATRYTDLAGAPLPAAPGQIWVVLTR